MDAKEITQQIDSSETTAKAEEQSSQKQEQASVADENMSDEAKLAAEALAVTEEPAEESPEIEGLKREDERLLGSITAKRHALRELDKALAEKMAAEKAALPPEKSPEEKYIEENSESFDPDTEPFPARVQIAQRKWEKEQAEKSRKRQEQDALNNKANMSSAKARQKYSDFDKMLLDAQDLLSEGDEIDLKRAVDKGDDGAEFLYRRCIFKILEAGGDRAKELRASLKNKVTSKASVQKQQTKQTTDGSEQKKDEEISSPSPKSEQEINPSLAHIYAAYGID